MSITLNPNTEFAQMLLERVKLNNGYCPCSLVHVPDMKCMCKEFLEMEEGFCHCGLYLKMKDKE